MNLTYLRGLLLPALWLFAGQTALSQTAPGAASPAPKVVKQLIVIPEQGVLADKTFVPNVSVRPDDKTDFCTACPKCCQKEKMTFKQFQERYLDNAAGQVGANTISQMGKGVVLKEQNLLIPDASYDTKRPAAQLKPWTGSLEIRTHDRPASAR